MRTRYALFQRYALAVIAVVFALALNLLLRPLFEPSFLFIFLAASVITARYAGLGPSLLAILLSVISADYFLLEPVNAFSLQGRDVLLLLIFAATALSVNSIYVTLRKTQSTLEAQRDQLQQDERRLQILLENMPVMLNITGGKDTSLTWNVEAERVTGYSAGEVAVYPNSFELLYPDTEYRASVLDFWQKHQGDYRDWEVTVTRKDGDKRVVSWYNVSKQFPIQGWADWAVGIDITERKRNEERVHLLQNITAALGEAITLDQVAEVIVSAAYDALSASTGTVYRMLPDGQSLEMLNRRKLPDEVFQKYRVIPLSLNGPLTEAIRKGEPIFIETMEAYIARYPEYAENIHQNGSQATACLPLIAQEHVIGGLSISFPTPTQMTDDFKALLLAVAQHCAQALERAQLFTDERQARERLAFLSAAGAVLASSLDYDMTLKHIARLAVPRVADWCSLDLLDETGALRQLIVVHSDEEKEELVTRFRESRMSQTDQSSVLMTVLRTRQPQVIPQITQEMIDAANLDEEAYSIVSQLNLRAAMYVPLATQGRSLGVISFGSSESERSFGQEDLRVAEALAARAALAIENARLYREAQEQRERLRVTLTSIGDAVIATDAVGRIIFINAVAEHLTGWNAADVTGKPLKEVFQIINEETRALVESPFDKVIQTGSIVGLANHTILITRDGGELPVDDSGAPIMDETGKIVGVILVFRDISERRRAEVYAAALQHLTAAFSEAVTMEQIAQLVVTEGAKVLRADMAIVMLLNEERAALEPLAHHNFRARLLEDYPITPLEEPYGMTDAVRTSEPLWFESLDAYGARYPHFLDKMRTETLQAFAFVPLLMDGETAGVLNIIFEKPHAFDEVEQNFIVTLAGQCSQALERARLYEAEQQARVVAEEANQLKMRFLGMISHELRTPLTSIKGFATTLLATDVVFNAEQQRHFVEVIDQEADKLTELIDQLLDLTRLQANTLGINPVICSLPAIIEVARAQLEMLTREHRLLLHVPEALPMAHADPQRVAQVLVNLVSNAAKFSSPGTQISVEARESDGFVKVRVSDEGSGIPMEAREYVFEAFRQLEGHGIQRKGAGLGLAISKALIEGHGGRIWIEDDTLSGTAIAFTLPLT